MPLDCHSLEETFLHAFVDGEFTPDESAEVKAHLALCPHCARAAQVHEAFREAVARAAVPAPHALHDTIRERLAAEHGPRVANRWIEALRDPRGIAVAAAVAGAGLWFAAGGLSHRVLPATHSLVEDGVALHARALPLDYQASDPSSAQRWLEGKLDFGVRLPQFARGPQLQGVRLSNVHAHQAAVVTYALPAQDGRRVSLLVYDDRDDPGQPLPGAARRVEGREVWMSRARGFNVASWRNDEIVYSLISDLDEADVLRLVQSAELR